MESKELQLDIQNASVAILKVYKAQYKPVPENISFSLANMSHGQSL